MPVVIPSSRAQKPVGRKVYGYISRLCLESSFPFFRSPGGAVKPPNVPCNVVYICVCVRSSNIPGGIDRISRYFTARRDKSTHLVIYVALREELRILRNFPFFCARVHNLRNAHSGLSSSMLCVAINVTRVVSRTHRFRHLHRNASFCRSMLPSVNPIFCSQLI